jgi:hypothetical protein
MTEIKQGLVSQAQTTPWADLPEDPNAGLYLHDEVLVLLGKTTPPWPQIPMTTEVDIGDNWVKEP